MKAPRPKRNLMSTETTTTKKPLVLERAYRPESNQSVLRIAHQSTECYSKKLTLSNGWTIDSNKLPEIKEDKKFFYLRGTSDSYDNSLLLVDNEVADEVIQAVHEYNVLLLTGTNSLGELIETKTEIVA